jgi:hypothetical protein
MLIVTVGKTYRQISNMSNRYLPLLLCLLLLQCAGPEKNALPDEVMGLAPIYEDGSSRAIESLAPQPIQRLGKIYYKDSLIFVGEVGRGIHIIDNKKPEQPERIAFIRVAGNTDISIKGDILYANNLTDLVAMDISDLSQVELLSRTPGVFPQALTAPPADYVGYFECPDPDLGAVVDWEERLLQSPRCWR